MKTTISALILLICLNLKAEISILTDFGVLQLKDSISGFKTPKKLDSNNVYIEIFNSETNEQLIWNYESENVVSHQQVKEGKLIANKIIFLNRDRIDSIKTVTNLSNNEYLVEKELFFYSKGILDSIRKEKANIKGFRKQVIYNEKMTTCRTGYECDFTLPPTKKPTLIFNDNLLIEKKYITKYITGSTLNGKNFEDILTSNLYEYTKSGLVHKVLVNYQSKNKHPLVNHKYEMLYNKEDEPKELLLEGVSLFKFIYTPKSDIPYWKGFDRINY